MFRVIFVLVIFSRLDGVQNENDQSKGAFEISPTCDQVSPIAVGCNNGSDLIISLKPQTATLRAKYENNCCDFRKINNSDFAADLSCTNFCEFYSIFFSENCPAYQYYLNGSYLGSSVAHKCPYVQNVPVNSSGCPLNNITVHAFHGNSFGYIGLNISWAEIDINETVEISTVLDEKNYVPRCGLDIPSSEYSIKAKNVEIFHETNGMETTCAYDIIIKNEFFLCSTYYMIPDCVGTRCNCQKYTLRPNITSVERLSRDEFLIKWDPGRVEDAPYTIEKIKYFYERDDKPLSRLPVDDIINTDFVEHKTIVLMKLFEGHNYTLTGEFFNNYSCSEEVTFDFQGEFGNHLDTGISKRIVPVQDNEGSPESFHFKNTYIILIVLSVILLLLVAWNYKIIQKCLLKVLHCMMPDRLNCESGDILLVPLRGGQISMNSNIHYTSAEFSQGTFDEYEVPRNRITIKECIGSGAFGRVYSAKAMGLGGVEGYQMVAVKILGEGEGENITREVLNDFISEIDIFKKVGNHPNVVALLGCCTLEPPYMIIMELVPCGNLKGYLEVLRDQWLERKKNEQVFFSSDVDVAETSNELRLPSTSNSNPLTPLLADYARSIKPVLDHVELQNFAFQIAKGMAHLEKVSITHRDLAARNILINQNKTLKISDFGLSRSGPYINNRARKLPLRWMAIEAIVEHKYDSKSDVWSFGVVLWEIGTLGAFPYESVPDSFVQQFLQTGGRLERPEICTDELYEIMQRCWAADPEDRPTFRELVDRLDVKKQRVYVDFNQLNPGYVFPPTDVTCVENIVRVIEI